MAQPPQSYNSRLKTSLRLFLLPGGADIALFLFFALMALLGLNARKIWDYFSSQNLSGQNLGQLIGQNAHVHNFIERISQGRILQGLFWALVGTFIYISFWTIKNLLVNVRNDIVADEYMHPQEYKRSVYWRSIITRKVAFAATVVVLIAYIYACVRLIPALARFCYDSVVNFSWSPSAVELVGSWLAVAGLIYLFTLLSRVAMIGWKLIYTDL